LGAGWRRRTVCYFLFYRNATLKKAFKIVGAGIGIVIVLNIGVRIRGSVPSYVFEFIGADWIDAAQAEGK
jgi:hypothetical protein